MALVVVALLGGGAVGGWYLRGRWSPAKAPVLSLHAVVKRSITPLTAAAAGAMPSLIGLAQAEAQRVLFDAGVKAGDITTTTVPAAGTAGLVVSQSPAAGTNLAGGTTTSAVSLGVSVAAKVPNLVGKTTADARDTLATLGARVTVTQRYSPTATEGAVLSVEPAAGSVLPLTASMVVASPASAAYLDTLKSVQEDCSGGNTVTSNATTYTHELSCHPQQVIPTTSTYVLNRKVTAFVATLGQDDSGQSGQTGTVSVLRDGKTVRTFTVSFGTQQRISVPVIGALRLTIMTRWSHPAQNAPGGPTIVLANCRMVGSPDAITALVAESGR